LSIKLSIKFARLAVCFALSSLLTVVSAAQQTTPPSNSDSSALAQPQAPTGGQPPPSVPLAAQDVNAPQPETGHITGTVTDVNNDVLSGATVVLQGSGLKEPLKVLSDDNGLFEFNELNPGTYHVTITAKDFADWTSPDLILNPGQFLIVTDSKLHIAKAVTTVSVAGSQEEIATEQVKIEETQRVFGIIPNFYVVYDQNPAPLTTKLKFHLALKTYTDVVTILGVGVLAAFNQAGDTPDYVQG